MDIATNRAQMNMLPDLDASLEMCQTQRPIPNAQGFDNELEHKHWVLTQRLLGSNSIPEPKYRAHTKHLFDSCVEPESRHKVCAKSLMGFGAMYNP